MSNFNENIKTLLDILNRPETTDGVQPSVALGTCDTASSEQHKIAVVPDGFLLQKGVRIGILFANNNTYKSSHDTPATLNVNGTGNFPIHTASGAVRGGDNHSLGWAKRYTYYTFTGNAWLYDGMSHIETLDPLPPTDLAKGKDVQARTVTAQYFKDAVEQIIGESPQQSEVDDISNVYGAKNLLPYPYYDGDSKTSAGVTFSVDANGVISANGTSRTEYCAYCLIENQPLLKLQPGKYILSTSQALPKYIFLGMWFRTVSTGANTSICALRTDNVEVEFEVTQEMANKIENGEAYIFVRVSVDSRSDGVVWNNVTLHPMIRQASIKDATWQPYVKTNRELTQQQYTFVGVCESAGNEQNKIVTVDDGFKLEKGVRIAVKFKNSNSFNSKSTAPITLNVNQTGVKSIYYNNAVSPSGTSTIIYGSANRYTYYIYDGTYWVWDSYGQEVSYSSMSIAELKAGTANLQRVVRADYLNQAITEMINEKAPASASNDNFIGTDPEWKALPDSEKAKYHTMDIIGGSKNERNIFDQYVPQTKVTKQFSSLQDLWTYAESVMNKSTFCLMKCGLQKDFGLGTDWVHLFVSEQNRVGNGQYDIAGRIILFNNKRFEQYSVTGGKNDVSDLKSSKLFTLPAREATEIVNQIISKNLLFTNFISKQTNGVTFTKQSNGSITVSGTATDDVYFDICTITSKDDIPLHDGWHYILSGCPKGGDFDKSYSMYIVIDNTIVNNSVDVGTSSKPFSMPTADNFRVRVRVRKGTKMGHAFYPMIKPADILDTEYTPYAKPTPVLTKDVNRIQGNIQSLRANNQIKFPYYQNSYISGGLTFEVNDDSSVTVSGTGSNFYKMLWLNREIDLLEPGDYYCSCGVDLPDGLYLELGLFNDKDTAETKFAISTEKEKLITIPSTWVGKKQFIRICQPKDGRIDSITIYPRIRKADDGKDNRQLTKDVRSLQAQVDNTCEKNLIIYPYTDNDITRNGVRWISNQDGSINVSGKIEGSHYSHMNLQYVMPPTFTDGDYIISVITKVKGMHAELRIAPWNGQNYVILGRAYGDQPTKFTITQEMITAVKKGSSKFQIIAEVHENTESFSDTIYPMLRRAEITDDTWQPYIKNTKQLSKDLNEVKSNLLSLGAVNQMPYPYYNQSKTAEGISWNVNADRSITINGTATKTTYFYFNNVELSLTPNTQYAASLGVDTPSSVLMMQVIWTPTGGKEKNHNVFTKSETIFSIPDSDINYVRIRLVALKDAPIDHLTVYPYIRKLTDGKSNKALTADTTVLSNQLNDLVNILGAKNLLKIDATSKTVDGVSFAVNSDDSISVSGTATKTVYYSLMYHDFGKYRFATDGNSQADAIYAINGLPQNPDFYLAYNSSDKHVVMVVKSGYTVNNVRVYPMIRLKSIQDATYKPYAMTNSELTEELYTKPTLATPNTAYVGTNMLYVLRIGNLVNVSGRFETTKQKPSNQENYLYSKLPIPCGKFVGWRHTNFELIINEQGQLTSNEAVPIGGYNVQFTYSCN